MAIAARQTLATHCILAAIVLCCFPEGCHAVACHVLMERPSGCRAAKPRPGTNFHFWYVRLWPPIHPVCSSHDAPASECAGGSWHCRWVCHPCGPPAGEGASATGAAVRSCAEPDLGELAAVLQQQMLPGVSSLLSQGQAVANAFTCGLDAGSCFIPCSLKNTKITKMMPRTAPHDARNIFPGRKVFCSDLIRGAHSTRTYFIA